MNDSVIVTATKVPSPTGTDKVRIEATWPAGYTGWLVRLEGADFSTAADFARKPNWSWTGFLADGRYRLHVEGFAPAPFAVTT